jgi:DNA-binding beta-propeller fold protein YncE
MDGRGAAATFQVPLGLAVAPSGNAFVTDRSASTIRSITPDGVVSLFAGRTNSFGQSDGIGPAALFGGPLGIASDSMGTLYVADGEGLQTPAIRRVSSTGVVTTIAGSLPLAAKFEDPAGIAVDAAGNVFIADTHASTIRKIAPDGTVSTLAGAPNVTGHADGAGPDARFSNPNALAVDPAGNVYVADGGNASIRKITPDGTTTTLLGGFEQRGIVLGSNPGLGSPHAIVVDGAALIISDGTAVLRVVLPP